MFHSEKAAAAMRNSAGERFARAVSDECASVESSRCAVLCEPSAASDRQPTSNGNVRDSSCGNAVAGQMAHESSISLRAAGLSALASGVERDRSTAT